jgi:hypothetical protein
VASLSIGRHPVDPDGVNTRDVFDDTLSGYRALWRYLGVLSLAFTVVVVLLIALLVVALGTTGVYAAVVLSVVASFWVTALLVQTIDDLHEDDGAEPSFRARLERFWPHVNRVSAAALLLSLLFAPGWLLAAAGHTALGVVFVLVGVAIGPWLVLAVPLIVIEGYGVGAAFAESRQAVSGNALRVFCVLFVLGFVTGILANAVEAVVRRATDSWTFGLIASSVLEALVTTPLMALAITAIYQALRQPAAAAPTSAPATA